MRHPLPFTWTRPAIWCSRCTLHQSEVDVWWLFQWAELFDKNKLQAAAVSSSESLLGFHACTAGCFYVYPYDTAVTRALEMKQASLGTQTQLYTPGLVYSW